jgi:hypothetical protein
MFLCVHDEPSAVVQKKAEINRLFYLLSFNQLNISYLLFSAQFAR